MAYTISAVDNKEPTSLASLPSITQSKTPASPGVAVSSKEDSVQLSPQAKAAAAGESDHSNSY